MTAARRRAGAAKRASLVLTCEHAGNRIPRRYASLFRGAGALLDSHRGWDPGALQLARLLARELRVPLLSTPWSRLLVEANRSLHNPRLWSKRTSALSRNERQRILELYWHPHRRDVEAAIAADVGKGLCAVHVAVHSFTLRLGSEVRNADIGLLYDSRRPRESALAHRWRAALSRAAPHLRVRYNYPYRGRADGLTTSLRRQHAPQRYLGFELEVCQALLSRLSSPDWRALGKALASSLAEALHDDAASVQTLKTAQSRRKQIPYAQGSRSHSTRG